MPCLISHMSVKLSKLCLCSHKNLNQLTRPFIHDYEESGGVVRIARSQASQALLNRLKSTNLSKIYSRKSFNFWWLPFPPFSGPASVRLQVGAQSAFAPCNVRVNNIKDFFLVLISCFGWGGWGRHLKNSHTLCQIGILHIYYI